MQALQEFQEKLICPLCGQNYDKPHSFGTCGHTFCYKCVIPTLEGPGISKSECPKCHQPGWKNDLVFNRTVSNTVELTQGLLSNVLARRRLQWCSEAPAPAASPLCTTRSCPHSAATAAAPPSSSTGTDVRRASTMRRRRRGRSASEEDQQEAAEEDMWHARSAEQQQQHLQQEAGGQQQQQPRVTLRASSGRAQQSSAAAAAAAAEDTAVGGEAVAAQWGYDAYDSDLSEEKTDSDSGTPATVAYDTDWEERMLAMPLPGPEELEALEAEVELIKQALLLCDKLPCLGGNVAPAAEGGGDDTDTLPASHDVPAAAAAPAQPEGAAACNVGAAAQAVGVVIMPDSEEPKMLPLPSTEAAPAATAAAPRRPPAEQPQAQQHDRKRMLEKREQHQWQWQRRQQRGREQERKQGQLGALPWGLTQEVEDETCRLSGRKRRKAFTGRSVSAASRLGKPGASATTTSAAAAGRLSSAGVAPPGSVCGMLLAPVVIDGSSDEDDAFKQPMSQLPRQQQQHQPQQGARRPSKSILRSGDAVEVFWETGGQVVPFHGRVVAIKGGQHEIKYLDDDVALHNLDDEQWRPLEEHEFQLAVQQWQQCISRSPTNGGDGIWGSGGGTPPASSASEGAGAAGAALAVAVAAAGRADTAAAVAGADPYQFISNTEAQLDGLPLGRLPLQQRQPPPHQRVQQVQPISACRPLLPPPKFHGQPHKKPPPPQQQHLEASEQRDPAWLQAPVTASAKLEQPRQHPVSAAATPTTQQQQFMRKRKAPADGAPGDRPAVAASADALGAPGQCASWPPEVPQAKGEQRAAAVMNAAPSTQDAAGALFAMLAEQPPATALPASGFVSASQLLAADAQETQQQQQQQAPALAGDIAAGEASERHRAKVLEDPGLFNSSSVDEPAPVTAAAACVPGGTHGASRTQQLQQQQQPQTEEEVPPMRVQDLFKGINTPSEAGGPNDNPPDAGFGSDELVRVEAVPDSSGGDEPLPGRRCLVISSTSHVIQGQALRLRALLGDVDLEDQVTERTTHVLMTVDDHSRIKYRSMQYLLALAHGCWVLSHAYVAACLDAGCWLPEKSYQAWGSEIDGLEAPMLARRRHRGVSGSGGLFAGRRIWLMAERGAAGSGGTKLASVQQMVLAEGGTLVRGPAQAEGGGRGGAATSMPSPSPEGATLLVWLTRTKEEALSTLKVAQKRYPGRPVLHQNWLFCSLCCGRVLDPADFVITEECPVPTYGGTAGSGNRASQSTQGAQA